MFKALMRVQIASVIASLMRSSKGNEKRSAASMALMRRSASGPSAERKAFSISVRTSSPVRIFPAIT